MNIMNTTASMDTVLNNRSRVWRSMPTGLNWCEHTFESGLYQCSSRIMEPVAVGVTESEFFAVPLLLDGSATTQLDKISNPLLRTFTIKFPEIADIDTISDSDAMGGTFGCLTLLVRNHTGNTFILHCYEHSTLTKRLEASWHSWLVRKSAYLPKLIVDSVEDDATQEYYFETLEALKDTADFIEMRHILDEMADDALLDLHLKDVAFKSREIFSVTYNIASKVLNGPLTDQEKAAVGKPSTMEALKMSENGPYFSRLHGVALQRLLLFRCCIKLIIYFLSNSEAVASRFNLFRGPHPVLLEPFVGLMVEDAYSSICETIGCATHASDDALSLEIAESLKASLGGNRHDSSSSSSNGPSVSSSWDPSDLADVVITPVSSHRRMTARADELMMTLGKDVLTPLKRRIESQQSTSGKSPFTLKLKQTVADMQMVALREIGRVINICPVGLAETKERIPFGFLGSALVRYDQWDDLLSRWLERVMALLDNFLVSDMVLTSLQTKATGDGTRTRMPSVTSPTLHGLDVPVPLGLVPPSPSRRRSFDPDDTKADPSACDPRSPLPQYQAEVTDSPEHGLPPGHGVPLMKGLDAIDESDSPKGNKGAFFEGNVKSPPFTQRKSMKPKKALSFHLCSFETQEILILHYCALIQSLCLDSARIREEISVGLSSYFVPIMNVFNTVVPRPSLEVIEKKRRRDRDDLHRREVLGVRGETYSVTNATRPSIGGMFRSFKSAVSSMAAGRFRDRLPMHNNMEDTDSPRTQWDRDAIPNEWLGQYPTADELYEKSRRIDITLFGKPRYDLSSASWHCLLVARRFLEETILTLGMNIPIDEILMEAETIPTPRDLQFSREVTAHNPGSKGGSKLQIGSKSLSRQNSSERLSGGAALSRQNSSERLSRQNSSERLSRQNSGDITPYTTPRATDRNKPLPKSLSLGVRTAGDRGSCPAPTNSRAPRTPSGDAQLSQLSLDMGSVKVGEGRGDLGKPTSATSPVRLGAGKRRPRDLSLA